jgi:3-oxoacyl-[acyl-carrier protein] reductase
VALVTGASRGIGRAICVALAARGCDLAVNYAHDLAAAEETIRLCVKASSTVASQNTDGKGSANQPVPHFVAIGGDVANERDCQNIYQQCQDSLGAPDILVNNAGITRDNLILRMTAEDFDDVLGVNLRAAFILCKLAVRSMSKKRHGRIINISSVVGLMGNAGQANYAASKAGLIGLTKSLAKEFGSRNITVNAVAPGFIETRMTEALGAETREQLTDRLAIPRLGSPDDVATAVAFLASDEAAYITGQVLAVDGGMTM